MFCGHSCMGSMQTMHIAAIVWEGEEGGEGRGGGRRGKGRREEREGEEGGEGRGGGRREGEKGHQLLFHVVDSIWRNERSPEFIKITSLHILNVLEFILFEMFEKYFFLIFSLFVYQ